MVELRTSRRRGFLRHLPAKEREGRVLGFIEKVFRLSPDGGNRSVELVVYVVPIAIAGFSRSCGRSRSVVAAATGIAIVAMVTSGVALAVTIVGTPKAEMLKGSVHADKIYGNGGNDRLYGYGGNDLLVGGKGADLLNCGTGRDVAIADTSDTLKGCEVVKGLPKPPAPPANPDGLYIALGTSISAGAGASAYSKQWVNLYFGYLASNGSGVTRLWSVVQAFDNTSDRIRTVGLSRAVAVIKLASDTLRVTLDVGLPDLRNLQGCDHPNNPACPFAENLRAILKTLNAELAQDPGNEIIQIMEYFNPYIGTAGEGAMRALLLGDDLRIDCSGTGRALGLNDLIHCIALGQNAIPVDVLPAFDAAGAAFLDPLDQFHPNDAGNLAIAKAFGGAVERTP